MPNPDTDITPLPDGGEVRWSREEVTPEATRLFADQAQVLACLRTQPRGRAGGHRQRAGRQGPYKPARASAVHQLGACCPLATVMARAGG